MTGAINNNVEQLIKQKQQIESQKSDALNNVAQNEQKANEIHEQVAKTTNDEDILNRQVIAATDNETKSLESARKNHEGAIDGLNKQREGLKEPTEPKKPADDADEAVKKEYADKKSQYEADMKAYKEQSAILDDAFKAENKRYEQELKDIEKKAKDDKNQAKADLEQAKIKLSKLLAQKDSNNDEINDLNRKISDLQADVLTKEQEIDAAKQAQKDEKDRLNNKGKFAGKDSGGIDGNTKTDTKAEKADAKADKKALKAAKNGVKDMDGVSDVKMDKKKGTVTYKDNKGVEHTVIVSGAGRGNDAQYKIANTTSNNLFTDTQVSDLGFKNGKVDIKEGTGSIRTDQSGNKTIISNNNDGSRTVSAENKLDGLSVKESTIETGNITRKATTSEQKEQNGITQKTTRTDIGGTTKETSVRTNKDGSTTKIDYSSINNSRTEVTEKKGETTNVTSYNNDKSKTSVNYRDDGATTMVNYDSEEKETDGLISRTDGNKTYDQGVTYKNNKAYTTTNVEFNETIDKVLERMGITKEEYGDAGYDAIKADFLKENKTKTRNRKQYFLAGQEVKVPVDLDKYKPTEKSTTPVYGKAEEDKWKQWFDGRAGRRH